MLLEECITQDMPNFSKFIKILKVLNAGIALTTQNGFKFVLVQTKNKLFNLCYISSCYNSETKETTEKVINTEFNFLNTVSFLCDEKNGISEEELQRGILLASNKGIYIEEDEDEDNYRICANCGDKLNKGEGNETQIDGIVCDNCFNSYYDENGNWKY